MSEYTKIKFCGMTRAEDVSNACALGVDALGFIFYPRSKRAIDLETAVRISQSVPESIDRIAVVVNPQEEWVRTMIKDFEPTLIQFHGDETPEFCQQFDYPYIKAIAATNKQAIIDAESRYSLAKALLIDTPSGNQYGGSGRTFSWDILPQNRTKPYILAGGLTVDNVVDAIRQAKPQMIDCSSGIETAPGIKSETLMRQFIQRIRGE